MLLNDSERYILTQREIVLATTIRKKAKTGQEYCREVAEAKNIEVRLCTVPYFDYTEVPNTMIFEHIFE